MDLWIVSLVCSPRGFLRGRRLNCVIVWVWCASFGRCSADDRRIRKSHLTAQDATLTAKSFGVTAECRQFKSPFGGGGNNNFMVAASCCGLRVAIRAKRESRIACDSKSTRGMFGIQT